MIPVELVLLLLNDLKVKGIALVETPGGRDAFAFGEAHGWIMCVAEMTEKLNAIIEQRAGSDDDNNLNRRPQAPGVQVEREYQF